MAVKASIPKISVLVACEKPSEDLKPVLEAIQANDYPDLDVIVVSSIRWDSSPGITRSFPSMRFIGGEECSDYAEARNHGLSLATSQYIALVNDNVVVAKNWILRLVDFLEARPRAAAAGGRLYFWDTVNPVGNTGNAYVAHALVDVSSGSIQEVVDAPDVTRRVATLVGDAVLIRRAAIEQVGAPFLEPLFSFGYSEADFFARAIRRGWDLYYVAESEAWRRKGGNTESIPRDQWAYYLERNRWLYIYRNYEDKALGSLKKRQGNFSIYALWGRLLSLFNGLSPEHQARWDAWAWCQNHRAELSRQRRVLSLDQIMPYCAAVEAIQSDPGMHSPGSGVSNNQSVSIIIANYNYERYLGEAIESALGQTYPSVEVIVVDDGSRDESLEVARNYPVTLISQSNQGVGTARNVGAAAARGDYYVFLDSDDLLEPEYVERCLEALVSKGNSVGYAYTWMRHFGADNQVYVSRPFTAQALLAGNFINVSALMRRDAFETAGGFDPTWRLGHEDYELWMRMLHWGIQGTLVPEPLLRYRRHGGGRNALSRKRLRELRWRMRLTYPEHYWAKLLKDPLRTLFYLFCFRGLPKRRRGRPGDYHER